jgi:hypothetical protein
MARALKLDSSSFVWQICLVKTVLVREFLKRWGTLSHQTVEVRKRGRVIGTWIPATAGPEAEDPMARLNKTFQKPLPFTGLQLLKEKKR